MVQQNAWTADGLHCSFHNFYWSYKVWFAALMVIVAFWLQVMGLNPPFCVSNLFVRHILTFEPKLVVLIVPPATETYVFVLSILQFEAEHFPVTYWAHSLSNSCWYVCSRCLLLAKGVCSPEGLPVGSKLQAFCFELRCALSYTLPPIQRNLLQSWNHQ